MKIKFNVLLITCGVVAAGVLIAGYFLVRGVVSTNTETEVYTYKNDLSPIDPPLSDTLPYRTYIETKRKINKARDLQNGTFLNGGGWSGWSVGVRSGYYCDTCTSKHVELDIPGANQHYIILKNWILKQPQMFDSVRFFVRNGKNYLRKPMVDTQRKVHYMKDVQVKFWYDDKLDCMLIRVDKRTTSVTTTLIVISFFLWFTCLLYAVACFLKFIIDLSKGLTFTGKNVARLKMIAIVLLATPLIQVILDITMRLIFWKYFTADIVLKTGEWIDNWEYLVASLVFFLLFKAFKQGMLLKEEHDLTV